MVQPFLLRKFSLPHCILWNLATFWNTFETLSIFVAPYEGIFAKNELAIVNTKNIFFNEKHLSPKNRTQWNFREYLARGTDVV